MYPCYIINIYSFIHSFIYNNKKIKCIIYHILYCVCLYMYIEFVIDHQKEIRELMSQQKAEEWMTNDIRDLIDDPDLFDIALKQHTKLSHINDKLASFQSKSTNLSDVYYAFVIDLPNKYKYDDEQDLFNQCIFKAWNLIKSDMHYASIATDPRYRDIVELKLCELDRCKKYFRLVLGNVEYSECKWIINDFIFKQGIFDHELFNECKPSDNKSKGIRAWYLSKGSFTRESEKECVEEIIFLLGIHTGITEIEKTFCGYRRFHGWNRYCLGVEKAAKMMQYSTNWRMRNNLF